MAHSASLRDIQFPSSRAKPSLNIQTFPPLPMVGEQAFVAPELITDGGGAPNMNQQTQKQPYLPCESQSLIQMK